MDITLCSLNCITCNHGVGLRPVSAQGPGHDAAAAAQHHEHAGEEDPHDDQDHERRCHRRLLAIVSTRIFLVNFRIVRPLGPGSEHHDRAPDHHGEDDAVHQADDDLQDDIRPLLPVFVLYNLLWVGGAGAQVLVPHLGDAADEAGDQEQDAGHIHPVGGAVRTWVLLLLIGGVGFGLCSIKTRICLT